MGAHSSMAEQAGVKMFDHVDFIGKMNAGAHLTFQEMVLSILRVFLPTSNHRNVEIISTLSLLGDFKSIFDDNQH